MGTAYAAVGLLRGRDVAIPVVLATGAVDSWPREALRQAVALVSKPFDLDQTVRLLGSVAAAAS
jgi:hypothetical protein